MNRRTFFANLLGGSVAALWPYPPKPIIVRAEERPKVQPIRGYKVCTVCGLSADTPHPNCAQINKACGWPNGETLTYRK